MNSVAKKNLPILYINLLYKIGKYFLERQYEKFLNSLG